MLAFTNPFHTPLNTTPTATDDTPTNRTPHSAPVPKAPARLLKPAHMSACVPEAPANSLYRRDLPGGLIELSSARGKQRFAAALAQGTADAFFPLVSQFQTQSHPALCGLTSLSTVLNALGIDPKRVWTHPWRWFTEKLLDCCLDMAAMEKDGITLDQLAAVARCQGTAVEVLRDLRVDDARRRVVESVTGRGDGSFEFVVASYDRRSLGQTGTGHFSPIAAYEKSSDSVLILDVARFKVRCSECRDARGGDVVRIC